MTEKQSFDLIASYFHCLVSIESSREGSHLDEEAMLSNADFAWKQMTQAEHAAVEAAIKALRNTTAPHGRTV